jgi:hypothetical protein
MVDVGLLSVVQHLLYAVRKFRQTFFQKKKAAHPKADGL